MNLMTDGQRALALDYDGADGEAEVSELAAKIVRLRLEALTLAAENQRLRDTVSYQLGNAILRARTWQGLLELPGELWRLRYQSLQKRGRVGQRATRNLLPDSALAHLRKRLFEANADEIVQIIVGMGLGGALAAKTLADLAASVQSMDDEKALALARKTLELDDSPNRRLWLAKFLTDAGMIEEPRLLYESLARKNTLPPTARTRKNLLDGMARVRDEGLRLPPARDFPGSTDRSVLYVAASSFPHHVTGYAARTHSLAKALSTQDWRIELVTRPGYPADRNDAQVTTISSKQQTIDGVTYTRLGGAQSNTTPFDLYCKQASITLLKHIRKVRPSVVHAASNYVNAVPVLMAARRAALPFVYEVRGLWELSNAARIPHWEGSEQFQLQRALETTVAIKADAVVALSDGLKSELVSRGVPPEKITIVPNCVDTDTFMPRGRDEALAQEMNIGDRPVVGFLGSMTGYEGLPDLVMAVAKLRGMGINICALLVGDGPAFRETREAARSLGVLDCVIMPGRVSPTEAPRWYSLMNVAAYPRRPARVTELVPPLKPLEAMSMELPVIASDVSAISETIVHQENGYLFSKGNVAELAELLAWVIAHPEQAGRIGREARRTVEKQFTWRHAASKLTATYEQLSVANHSRLIDH